MLQKILSALGLVALPLMTAVFSMQLIEANGPLYYSNSQDPSYTYLLNALLLAEGKQSGYAYHPGLPMQLCSAAVLRVTHNVAGFGALRDDVFERPEFYLRTLQYFFLAVFTAQLIWLGTLARALFHLVHPLRQKENRSLWGVWSLQSGFFLITLVLGTFTKTGAECALLILCTAFTGGVLKWLQMSEQEPRPPFFPKWGLAAGALLGLTLADKVTAAPLVLIPLWLLDSWRKRLAFLGVLLVALGLALLPAASAIGEMLSFLWSLSTHQGIYGQGEQGVLPQNYFTNLRTLVSNQGLFSLVWGFGVFTRWYVAPKCKRPQRTRLLEAVLAAQLLQVLMVAKHPSPHYLLPGLLLTGLVLFLCHSLWLERPVPASAPTWKKQAVLALPALLLVGGLYHASTTHWKMVKTLRKWREAEEKFFSALPKSVDLEHSIVLHVFPASTPAFALSNGFAKANSEFGPSLRAKFMGTLYLDGSAIYHFDQEIPRNAFLTLVRETTVYLLCNPWRKPDVAPFPGLQLKEIKIGQMQGLWQFYYKPAEPSLREKAGAP